MRRSAMLATMLLALDAGPCAIAVAQPALPPSPQLFVYAVQHGRATAIATSLTNLYGGTAPAAPAAAPAPDAAATQGMSPEEAKAYNAVTAANAGAAPAPVRTTLANQKFSLPAQPFGGAGNIAVSADDADNILNVLATPVEYERLLASLRQLDVEPPQVFLEMAIVEVTLSNNLNYGLQYFFQPGNGQNQIVLSNGSTTSVSAPLPGFGYSFSGSGIQVVLNALSARTKVNVISAPKLLVLNAQTATLIAGARVPIATEQTVDIAATNPDQTNKIDYRDTGVVLKVTPRVAYGGMVTLDVNEEVSQPTVTSSSKIDSPTFQQRQITSQAAAKDGDTIALGGLIADEDEVGDAGIPYLQDIPLLGKLFGSTGDTRTRTELIVLITPHVVQNAAQARAITEQVQRNIPAVAPLVGAPH